MNRCLVSALLVGVGILLGMASSSLQQTHADPPAAVADIPNADAATELREIKTQLKEMNAYLRTGVVKVVVVMNPDR